MRIYVCVKHVPDTAANIKITGEKEFSESIKFVMNPYDEYAVEEAVKTAEKFGGEVVAICVGKPDAMDTIRSALSVGADRGIFVKTDRLLSGSRETAAALTAAIAADGAPDLIFAGKQSIDSEGMQTHYRLAAALGLPAVSDAISFSLKGDNAVVECETGAGERLVLQVSTPCVIGCAKGLNEPRYPKLPDRLKAKKKPVKEIAIADLGVAEDVSDMLLKLEAAPERGRARMMSGEIHERVRNLVTCLEKEGVL